MRRAAAGGAGAAEGRHSRHEPALRHAAKRCVRSGFLCPAQHWWSLPFGTWRKGGEWCDRCSASLSRCASELSAAAASCRCRQCCCCSSASRTSCRCAGCVFLVECLDFLLPVPPLHGLQERTWSFCGPPSSCHATRSTRCIRAAREVGERVLQSAALLCQSLHLYTCHAGPCALFAQLSSGRHRSGGGAGSTARISQTSGCLPCRVIASSTSRWNGVAVADHPFRATLAATNRRLHPAASHQGAASAVR